jgi:hypothetical protein
MIEKFWWNVGYACASVVTIAISSVIVVACFNAIGSMLGLR